MSGHSSAIAGAASGTDLPVWKEIEAERGRQEAQLELIASENHASREVMAAMGTVLTNKYAEGYPGRRYYGGCEHVDVVEELARERAKSLFGASQANVQPHSGTQANIAVLMALLQPRERILAMSLAHGGHLSHGHPKNFSGLFYEIHSYGVEPGSERIDMQRVREQALAVRPKLILAGASAYSRTIDFPAFAAIAREVGALLMVDMAHIAGLVAAGLHPTPVGHAHVVTLTTHKTLRGPRGGLILCGPDEIKQVNSAVFPGGQGGPLMHVIAAKAIALQEALQPAFKSYQRRVLENARELAQGLEARGLRIVSGGTDNHLMLVDVGSIGLSGQRGRGLAARGGPDLQQEPDPVRQASADGGLGHPSGHARDHDPRPCACRHAAPRGLDRRCPAQSAGREPARARARRGRRARTGAPDLRRAARLSGGLSWRAGSRAS